MHALWDFDTFFSRLSTGWYLHREKKHPKTLLHTCTLVKNISRSIYEICVPDYQVISRQLLSITFLLRSSSALVKATLVSLLSRD